MLPLSPTPRPHACTALRLTILPRCWILWGLLFLVLLVLWPTSAHAADPTFNRRQLFGPGNELTESVTLGDMNGDGSLDIVTSNFGDPSKVYFNDGRGHFPAATVFSHAPLDVAALADLNGDGALDVISRDRVLFNDGSGNFSSSLPIPEAGSIGDINGDGALDIVSGDGNIYFNDGAGKFPASSPAPGTGILGDLNGDKLLDIIVGYDDGQGRVYFNSGAGEFPNSVSFGPGSGDLSITAVGDLNRDSSLDIVVRAFDPNTSRSQTYIFFNDGTGRFPTSASAPDTNMVADMSGDGILDFIDQSDDTGQGRVYFNDGAGNFPISAPFGSPADWISDLTVGDVNNDGALDIIGIVGGLGYIYFSNGGGIFSASTPFATGAVKKVAVGDMNGDERLDVITAGGLDNYVYFNDGSGHFPASTPFGSGFDWTVGVTVGDLNGDDALDIIAINSDNGDTDQDYIYFNDRTGNFPTSLPYGVSSILDERVAIGDVNGDGALDVIVGSYESVANDQEHLYLNDGAGRFPTRLAFGPGGDWTEDLAVGDLNDDGALDVVVINSGRREDNQDYIYFNDRTGYFPAWVPFGPGAPWTGDMAIGDMNGDGALDVVTGSNVYFNDGAGRFPDSTPVEPRSYWDEVAVSDMNGDRALDIVAGGYIYFNDGVGSFSTSLAVPGTGAVGDMNGDGTLDIVSSDGNIYWNRSVPTGYVNSPPAIAVRRPGPTADAPFYSTPAILSDQVIAVPFTLFDAESDPAGQIRVYFSPNGGGQWFPAIPAAGTQTTNLATAPYPEGRTHTFLWDTLASGIFGRYDNVVLRFEVSAQPPYSGKAGTYRYPNAVPGPFLWPYASATTFPFRVRGTQVRVFRDGQAEANAVAGALVYRLPYTDTVGSLMRDAQGQPLTTDTQGYLAGHGVLYPGDRLLALAPVRTEGKATLYHTNGRPTESGVESFTVAQSGVQPLVVSADNPLLLFDLTVSLEWDASKDTTFLAQLRQRLQQTSAALYDWSNGQVALGQVTVYQNREQWETADIRLYASNQLRPVANRGGVVEGTRVLTDPRLDQPITAVRGEVRIGTVWSRYGEPTDIGSDWPNVLAHELGHYLLFLEDTYLGLDEATGLLVPVNTCTGTAMSDPYEAANSEFRAAGSSWQADCGQSLAELPDWELIRLAYPELKTPPPANAGPAAMPFGLTTVTIAPPPAATAPLLDDANIELGQAGDLLAGGRAYLLKSDRLVDLGQPVVNAVQAWGAQSGDELCVFGRSHFTCATLNADQTPRFSAAPLWTPELSLTPVNTTTVRLLLKGSGATVTLYPNGSAAQQVTLQANVAKQVTLKQPAVEVWVSVQGPEANQRLITGYSIGAGPGRIKSHAGPGRIKSHAGPFTSGDGAVTIYPPDALPDDVFLVAQTAPALPAPPPGLTPIGRGYHIQTSATLADYTGGSLTFQYLGMDLILAGVPEKDLAVYYWDGTAWQRLATVLNRAQNFASAALPGPGLYTLMSGHAIPLATQGWNILGYTIEEPRPVAEALASIEGYYTTVYGYEAGDAVDPWKVYGADAPDWVNDLTHLETGRGYWIYATQPITLYLEGVPLVQGAAGSLPSPPATFYGKVQGSADFKPAAGMVVEARIAGKRCGQSKTLVVDGQVVYKVDVAGAGEVAGCGIDGQRVRFSVGGHVMPPQGVWSNQRVQSLALTPQPSTSEPEEPQAGNVYLPVTLQTPVMSGAAASQQPEGAQAGASVYLPLLAR